MRLLNIVVEWFFKKELSFTEVTKFSTGYELILRLRSNVSEPRNNTTLKVFFFHLPHFTFASCKFIWYF